MAMATERKTIVHGSPLGELMVSPRTDVTLSEFVLSGMARFDAERPAVVDVNPDTLLARIVSFRQLFNLIGRVAQSLVHRHGLKRGEVVALYAHNSLEYPVLFHAVGLVGGIITTINPAYTIRELEHQLKVSGARFLFFSPTQEVTAKVLEAVTLPQLSLRNIFAIDPLVPFPSNSTPTLPSFQSSKEPILLLSSLLEGQTRLFTRPKDPSFDARKKLVVLPFSSGTTGLSKGVMLTHHNIIFNLLQTTVVEDLNPTTTITAFLPMFHIYGMAQFICHALWRGATIVTMPRFEFVPLLDSIQKYHISRAYVVPPIVVLLAKSPLVSSYDLSSLRIIHSAAAPLSPEVEDLCRERFPQCKVKQAYGMTELSPVSHFNQDHNIRRGSVGMLVPSTECRIVDPDTREDCDVGQDGELWLRGHQVMLGYLNNPEATKQTIVENGWLRTGDIGHVDQNGFYYIVDRIKDLIKFKGFQVVPAELEGVILSHPLVADAAVIGKKDERAGEIPKALVVLKDGVALSATELQEFVAKQVAPFKRLQEVEFVEEIPKTPSGKILRRLLKERQEKKEARERSPSSPPATNPFRSRL